MQYVFFHKAKRLYLIFAVIFCTLAFSAAREERPPRIQNWVCYYGSANHDSLKEFDLLVLDGFNHPSLNQFQNLKALGYFSIGEINIHHPLWPLVNKQDCLIQKNTNWNSWRIDIRNTAWQTLVFKKAIPFIAQKGFDGFFLDTLDSVIALEDASPKEFEASKAVLIKMIKKLRKMYPDKIIAVNRGLPILSEIANDIDYVLIEALSSYYDHRTRQYKTVDPREQNILLNQIRPSLQINPQLNVLTLDYALPEQKALIDSAIRFSRDQGFIPYVSTYKLDQVFLYDAFTK